MNEAAGAGHIVNYNRRIAGNVLPHVPANGPTVCVETPARRESDDQTKRLSFIETVVAGRPGNPRDETTDDQAGQEVFRFAAHKCSFLVHLAVLSSRSS
ncbi:MAG TPA: hypothetical protein VHK27_13610 [Gammaproteobacteria bacterium]|nr:hypothetical protein [Gammaproteobacteria bacterium]